MPRLRFPRVHIVQHLSSEKCWTPKQLASRADLGLSTVTSLLAGRGVFLSTVISVARALGLADHRVLLSSSDPDCLPAPVLPALKTASVQIKIIFSLDAKMLADPEVAKLLNEFRRICGATGDIEPDRIEEGSIIATVTMLADDLAKALVAFAEGKLSQLSVTAFIIPADVAVPVALFMKSAALASLPPSLALLVSHATASVLFGGPVIAALIVAAVNLFKTNRPLVLQRMDDGSITVTREFPYPGSFYGLPPRNNPLVPTTPGSWSPEHSPAGSGVGSPK